MKTIGIALSPENIFNKCSYWTLNRVLLSEDANHSKIINDAYGMTTDDKEYFFNEQYENACSELSVATLNLRKKLILTDDTGVLPTGFANSFLIDRTTFYYKVADAFPIDIFMPLMVKYIKLTILGEWYKLKKVYDEVQSIDLDLGTVKKKIRNIANTYCKDGDVVLPYNNGFTVKPTQIDSANNDTIINVGDIKIFSTEYSPEFD